MLARLLNHLFEHDAPARAELTRFQGRAIRLTFPVLQATLQVGADGVWLASEAEPEATLTLSTAFFITLLVDRVAAQKRLQMSGDAELAAGIGRVLGQVRWDAAEELSQLIGDVAAQRLVWLAGIVGGIPGAIASRMLVHLVEYWRDEAPLLANRPAVDRYCSEVDTLRDDVARLAQRLALLEQKTV
ncbi:ubiquinone biosynthesis protein UbiJ [Andreprevotia lacus DSM 23236]|jgi:ubiquinone biosynthesis protein UbiJ|uniref:Ubiquinone biosynthesis accessory factor UbiJ n=1 Tax=Andreprevotia lacus DSM 23236 TaxID=1121001 RepID=A0A1W1X1U3_9NEIS|nr:SCP2 sterol-binding domain-containing protein [Andreprevotia lacus]SMC17867.1 ubiquinone biosynthesis protein UbiJ [Andreprevotia lacus DSM 23236]